jgi:uncharacterized protein (TIGR01777 family)
MKHYLITGGTGLIGTALCKKLLSESHAITILSRQPDKVSLICGDKALGVKSLDEISGDTQIDTVINLAGAPVLNMPWSKSRKNVIEKSRIDLTATLIDWISSRKQKPACLISSSAVGWYGDSGNSVIIESSSFHDEYTHQLCEAWEQEALRADQLGVRVCIIRIGLVLALSGGFLQKMLLPFKLGLGAQLGDGKQYMPWIHIDDIVNLFVFLIENQNTNGIFNGCAPNPVTNQAFTQTLAKHLHRPAFLTIPAWFLKLTLGEMSSLLLAGQQALPDKARLHGYSFLFDNIDTALDDVFLKKSWTRYS